MKCINCGQEFNHSDKSHLYCERCFKMGKRTCKNCGKLIDFLPKNYTLCKECFYKRK